MRRRVSLAWPVLAGDTAADATVYVTLGWLAAQTGDLSASAILAANTVPALALMLVGGAVGDRFGVVRVATWTTTLRAGLLGIFAALVALNLTDPIILVIAALVLGIVDAVHQPAVYGIVAVLAEDGQQRSSQAMVVGITRTVGVIGTVTAGFLIGQAVELPLVVGAACLMIAALSASRVPLLREDHDDSDDGEGAPSLWRMTTQGLMAVRRDRTVMAVLMLFTVGNLVATAPLSLGVPLMAQEYGWSGGDYGLVYAGFGLGQVVGGAALVLLSRSGIIKESRLGIGVAATMLLPAAACLGVLGGTASVGAAAISMTGVGLFLAPGASILMGFVRERTPTHLQGRVNGLIVLSITASIPLGMLAFGALVRANSVGVAISLSGASLAVAALLALIVAGLSKGRSGQPQVPAQDRSSPKRQLR